MPEKAIIYVPHDDLERATITCLEYARESGYLVEGIVVDRWEDVEDMLYGHVVDLVIAAEPWHPPPDRVPRIEIVSQQKRPPHPPAPREPGDDEGPPTPPERRRPKQVG